jgi:WD40 repeat protein
MDRFLVTLHFPCCGMLCGKSRINREPLLNHLGLKSLSALLPFALCILARGQTATCSLPSPSFASGALNIFSDRQEQDLGDALAENAEPDLVIAPPAADDQITRIGQKLVDALPPTGIHYQFRVYDSGEINGFSLAGGRVYISRKLVAAVQNEDELAGVLAHEIGHISTHQIAIEMTRLLKVRLGVTQVGDRADIFAKIHKLLSTPAKNYEPVDNEEKDQFIADRVALYALVRVGYAPESFASFLNQSMINKGKTGNWFTDAFGLTHEESQRYRRALKLISELPSGCAGKKPGASDVFLAWQKQLVEERVKSQAAGGTGDLPFKLDPPLRPTPWRIRFSPDGKYVLTQDDASIVLIDRLAPKVLFRIDAPYAEPAQFSPDSLFVVFHDSRLRVEKWDIAAAHRLSAKEMVVYDGCSQTLLSSDGRTLACARVDLSKSPPRIGIRILDVESGQTLYDKPAFFEMNPYADYSDYFNFFYDAHLGVDMVTLVASSDSHYLLVVVAGSRLAYDLQNRREIPLGGKLKGMMQSPMSFVGPDELFLVDRTPGQKQHRGKLYSYPDGELLKEIDIGDQYVAAVSKGRRVLAWPLADYVAGVVDIDQNKFVAATKLSTIDAWDDWFASEDPRGGIQIRRLGGVETVGIPIPVGPLPGMRAAAFSPDGKYLAVSLRNRGAIWDLTTGKQLRLTRPMRSLWISEDDHMWAQYPKYGQHDPVELSSSLSVDDPKELGKYNNDDLQYQNLQIHFKPMGKDKNTRVHATLEVKKMDTQAVLWDRDYPREAPACWPADDNRLVLGWDQSSATAKDEIKSHPQLQREADALKDKNRGLLIETVSPETGAPLEQVVLPEADLTHGWDDVRRAWVSGEFVLVRGEHGNTVIYRLDTGVKTGEFFGTPLTADAGSSIMAATNRDDEIILINEKTGSELGRFTLGQPVRLAKIVGGKTLFVLTADQVVHRLPLAQ